MTYEELESIRRKVSGLHFAKEALTARELEIFYLAEDLLAEVDLLDELAGWTLWPRL